MLAGTGRSLLRPVDAVLSCLRHPALRQLVGLLTPAPLDCRRVQVALQLAQWMAETGQAAKDDITGGPLLLLLLLLERPSRCLASASRFAAIL